jgi:DNA processing protein
MPHDDAPQKKRGGVPLSYRQKLSWLRLIRSDNVGPATFRDLINHFGSAEAAIEALPDLSRRGGAGREIRIATVDEAEREFEVASRFGARFIGIGEPGYPPLLRSIDAAPPLLAVKGNLAVTGAPAVAIVGARNASVVGGKFAARLAREIGAAGYTIISGLARGIDAAAHRASLDTGTMAAMAGGLDRPYPAENLELYEAITEGNGLAISEMPFGWEPRARDFPRRNRLVAGVAHGLVVVEAATRSGSLISARKANEFGRLVFAVPGSPLDPRSGGTNGLLKEGAILTTGSSDVLEALAPVAGLAMPPRYTVEEPAAEAAETIVAPSDDDRSRLIAAMGPTPVAVDDLAVHTGVPVPACYLMLLELDLAGRLDRHPGGLVSLAAPDF